MKINQSQTKIKFLLKDLGRRHKEVKFEKQKLVRH